MARVKLKLKPLSATAREAAARLAITIFFVTALGYALLLPSLPKRGVNVEYADEVAAACKWAAITCIVINSPLLAKCAQTGAERVAGTLVGGVVGFGAYSLGDVLGARVGSQAADGLVLAVAAAVVAWLGSAGGAALGLSYSTKLFSQTFILVAFGAAADEKPPGGAAVLAASRVLGIGGGVLLMELASIALWPRTATQGCLLSLAEAARACADASEASWRGVLRSWASEEEERSFSSSVVAGGVASGAGGKEGGGGGSESFENRRRRRRNEGNNDDDDSLRDIEAPLLFGNDAADDVTPLSPRASSSGATTGNNDAPFPSSSSSTANPSPSADALDAAAATLQSSLASAADLAQQADAEIYVGGDGRSGSGRRCCRGTTRLLFLPGPGPWTPASLRALPKPEVERACSALRKVGRALSALHASRPRSSGDGGGAGGGSLIGVSTSGSDENGDNNNSKDAPSMSSSSSPARAIAASYPGVLGSAATRCVSALRSAAAAAPGPPPSSAREAAAAFREQTASLLHIVDHNRRALDRAAARGARRSGGGAGGGGKKAAARAASEPVREIDEEDEDEDEEEEDENEEEENKSAAPSAAFASPFAAAAAAAAAAAPTSSSSPSTAATTAARRSSLRSLRRLNSRQAASAAFPPTREGFEATVLWYSLLLALRELSDGLCEALEALDDLSRALPAPLAVAIPRSSSK